MDLDISPFISKQHGRKKEQNLRQYKQVSFTLYTNLVAELVDLMCCYLLLVTEALINFKKNVAIFADDKKTTG